jgi:hypothetical protein
MSSIIGAVAALLLVVSSACIIVYSVRGAAVVPASAPRSLIYTPQSVQTRAADQEELRKILSSGKARWSRARIALARQG